MPNPGVTVRTVLADPEFQSASPEVRAAVFDRVAAQDPEYANAPPEAKAIVRQRATSMSSNPEHGSSGDWNEKSVGTQLKEGVGAFASNYNPIEIAKGAWNMLRHPVDTYTNDANARETIRKEAQEDLQAGGSFPAYMAKALEGEIPMLGPSLYQRGQEVERGDWGKGYFGAAGLGLSLMGPSALEALEIGVPGNVARVAQDAAAGLYRKALNAPATANAAQLMRAVGTGLKEGIPVSKSGAITLQNMIGRMKDLVDDTIARNATKKGKLDKVMQNVGEVEQAYQWRPKNRKNLAKIEDAKQELLDRFRPPGRESFSEAGPGAVRDPQMWEMQKAKEGIYESLNKEYQKPIGQKRAPEAWVDTQKGIARGLKEELVRHFPILNDWNTKASGGLTLQAFLNRAVNKAINKDMFGVVSPLTGIVVEGLTHSVPTAFVAAVMKRIWDAPGIKSRLAIELYRASKGTMKMSEATLRVAGFVNVLTQAVQREVPPEGEEESAAK